MRRRMLQRRVLPIVCDGPAAIFAILERAGTSLASGPQLSPFPSAMNCGVPRTGKRPVISG